MEYLDRPLTIMEFSTENDIMCHNKTQFDEHFALLISDYVTLCKSVIKLAQENGIDRELSEKILEQHEEC